MGRGREMRHYSDGGRASVARRPGPPFDMVAPRQDIRFCTSADGTRIAYATAGRGAPLVKAANWLSHLEFDCESPVWVHWVRELSRDHTLVRYDERGCGLSDWEAEQSFEAWLTDLDAVVAAAGVDRFPLLGLSQGASIAIAYAVRHPERVTHLVLMGGFARGRARRGMTAAQLEEAAMMRRLAEIGWGQENPAFRQFFTSQFIPSGNVEQHRWFNELARVSTSPASAARLMGVSDQIDVTDLLPRVQCPTLVLHAARDARVPFDEGRRLAALIPGARFLALDSANHVLLEVEPAWPVFVEAFYDFVGAGEATPQATPGGAGATPLTGAEAAVLELLARGLDNHAIARQLGKSEKTVRNQVSTIFDKLGVRTRAEAIVYAIGGRAPR